MIQTEHDKAVEAWKKRGLAGLASGWPAGVFASWINAGLELMRRPAADPTPALMRLSKALGNPCCVALEKERDDLREKLDAARTACAEVDRASGDAPHEPCMGVAAWIRCRFEIEKAEASGDEKLRKLLEWVGKNIDPADRQVDIEEKIESLLAEPAKRPTDDEVDAYMAKEGYVPIEKPAQETERLDADDEPLERCLAAWSEPDVLRRGVQELCRSELARRATGGKKQC